MLNLFDEIDGRLTRCTLHCPDLGPRILGVQKHVKYALNNEDRVDWQQMARDTLGTMTALMVVHPELWEDLEGVVQKLKDEIGQS